MAFAANPLSLSVPEAAFETWLRDSGYLEILDDRTASASASANRNPSPTAAATTTHHHHQFLFLLLRSLLLPPHPRLPPRPQPLRQARRRGLRRPPPPLDPRIPRPAAGATPGPPAPPGRMRVQENVRRYARNYAFLSLLFFAAPCEYRMPISLLGLMSSLVIWELVRFCNEKWDLEQRFPGLRQVLVRFAQFATAVILYLCNLQLTLISAIGVSYAVMILHASLRKLTPSNQPNGMNRNRRSQHRRLQFFSK
ncbi:PRA1 family protein H [Ananas comosus]|uniref:PRA1 family protein n=1 Tax=Ananas comosus TaxID=4615 RepID=A0A199W1E0_ANACO|nr:PRA1 family protein H [Ananas comosus]